MSRDATSALLRACAGKLGRPPIVEEVRSRSWASVTFSGARHELSLRVPGEGAGALADAFLADLDEAQFRLPGHILADIALVGRADGADGVTIRLEALTVEED